MFALATAYVLSGPILMLSGEKMSKKVPVLRGAAIRAGAPSRKPPTIAARPALYRIASTHPQAASPPIASGTARGPEADEMRELAQRATTKRERKK